LQTRLEHTFAAKNLSIQQVRVHPWRTLQNANERGSSVLEMIIRTSAPTPSERENKFIMCAPLRHAESLIIMNLHAAAHFISWQRALFLRPRNRPSSREKLHM
jgi:hypothetical protein